jgi:hypothetical protein
MTQLHILVLLAAIALSVPVSAQTRERPRPASRPAAAPQSKSVQVGGFAMLGNIGLTATESFDAIVGTHTGMLAGGGARIGLPFGGLFAEVGAWRMHRVGERVFISNGVRVPLGIHEDVTLTPIEFSGGWRFRIRQLPKFTPYAAGGMTSMRYQESSDFSADGEDTDQNYLGYHVFAGAEYKLLRWLGIAGEGQWTTIPDAIGEGGVSAVFHENDLGGKSFRVKITVGR